MYTKRKCSQLKKKDGREAPCKPSLDNFTKEKVLTWHKMLLSTLIQEVLMTYLMIYVFDLQDDRGIKRIISSKIMINSNERNRAKINKYLDNLNDV